MPDPLYTAEICRPAYQLNWSLSVFWRSPAIAAEQWLDQLKQATETDGVRILEYHARSPVVSQFLISTRPETPLPAIVRSVKGRLQYLVRNQIPKAFRRNYSIHSIGSASRTCVEEYVRSQLAHHHMADERVQARLERYQICQPQVDLSAACRGSHGEFRFNLHVVLVREGRWNEIRDEVLSADRQMIVNAARARRHRLSRAAILPDHVHLLIGCNLHESPQEVALGYLNNLAFVEEMRPVFKFGYYVGTIGEYDLGVVRRGVGVV